MPRQYTGVVADALVFWVSYHLHGDELRAERQHVDVCVNLENKKHIVIITSSQQGHTHTSHLIFKHKLTNSHTFSYLY